MRGRATVVAVVAMLASATGTGVTSEVAGPARTPEAKAAGFAAGVESARPADAPPPATPAFWFHGTQQDQANNTTGPPYTATFDKHSVTGTTPVQQTTTVGSANSESVANPLGVFWD